jgi:acetylornithine deacetylase/succinyl-diaminopimelate desuccinylase-like protein
MRDEAAQRRWEEACAAIRPARIRELLCALLAIPTPTGGEREGAEYLAGALRDAGLDAHCQPLDERQANAVARLGHGRPGPTTLLYAPIDTHTTGDPERDVPWAAPGLRADMRCTPTVEGDLVLGLGASNPKGHAACVVAAAEALAASGVAFHGEVLFGLGAGGMPSDESPAGEPWAASRGHGRGCAFLLDRGGQVDQAIIAKPGNGVAWEEAGLCWLRLDVDGAMAYAGSRHRGVYRNPIVVAGDVIARLERWFADHPVRAASEYVSPQGAIGAVRAGWPGKPAFSPARCSLYLDVRTSPSFGPPEVGRAFDLLVADLGSAHPDFSFGWEMLVSIPATSTASDADIVGLAERAWEEVHGAASSHPAGGSGATDGNILRRHGIPTARVGMPRAEPPGWLPKDFSASMNTANLRDMEQFVRLLLHVVCHTDPEGMRRP